MKDNSKFYDSYISVGYGKELDMYKDYFCDIDDALPLISVRQPIIFRSSDVFLAAERRKSSYYKNHLDPAGMHYSIEGNLYVEDKGYVVGLGLHRSNKYEDFTQKELELMKLMRPHLSRVAKRVCEARNSIVTDTALDYDFSNFDEIGFWIWNWNGKLVRSAHGDNEFIKVHEKELVDIIHSLCNNLKQNIQVGVGKLKYCMKSKVLLGSRTYYINLSFKTEKDREDGVFIAMVYDYMSMIDGILDEMKDEHNFTDREFDVLKCMVQGMSNQEIMDSLYISMPTVKKHLTNIYKKLEIEGRHQLIHRIL